MGLCSSSSLLGFLLSLSQVLPRKTLPVLRVRVSHMLALLPFRGLGSFLLECSLTVLAQLAMPTMSLHNAAAEKPHT